MVQHWEKFLNLNQNETKEFFEGACNSLLINADKDPIIDNKIINKMTFWDHSYSEMKITFIDLIKV
ncbi:hypothetical protein RhiirA1_465473 [Rhizophagus irregularis]|uniref:Uncharacterized protein n=1 Tax=Rhizophagus irregularis TaxID=588596 RepID=A0A2N0RFV6_9GLOM|nr:hypothetical protein RhiirA1_465473 [Rhizophagus irregularis]